MFQLCLAICLLSPQWLLAPPIRNIADPTILGDIESHLPVGHPYGDPDPVGFVHEGTHGINSLLRNQYGMPCFYLLNNRFARIREPLTTLDRVARRVPPSLRGSVYRLYLIQMQRYWNNQPSYILDEYVAYTNGAEAREKLGIKSRTETIDYMLEMSVYATCLARETSTPQLKEFLKWQMTRVMDLYRRSGYTSPYIIRLKGANDEDAKRFKDFAAGYYGGRSGTVQGVHTYGALLDCVRVPAQRLHAESLSPSKHYKGPR